ncbi:cytochrome P450 [Streptomyces beijiangensis]|uniref:Cytochrome P450 n=1 Tax=Streptomyces beijiangensis TaxID=163361 RepID=A0A939FDV3_9ACTN|nr:cytochrome P450 [Streptomyces beijiangensis]MBO0516294.1 cytochrome P450 [Streptomyces beijiangensis]
MATDRTLGPPGLFTGGRDRDPYPVYRVLRERYPLVYDARLDAWLVSRYADVVSALTDPRLVRPRSTQCCEPGDLRCTGASSLGGQREIAERTAYVLARRLAGRAEVDLVAEFCRWLPVGVLATAARMPYGALAGLRVATTERALASLLANLLDHPAQLAALRAAPGLIPHAWAESLRRDPPVHVLMRRAVRDVPLGGGTVPAGATVACLVGAAGRDPDRFANPDRFDLHRSDTGRLSIGCPATLQAQYGVRALLDAMPGLRWADGFRPVETGLLTRSPRILLVRTE